MAENHKENIPAVPAMKLELVPIPVSDVDRAKAFYVEQAGFTLEVDVRPTDTMRVVQLTPPGSACSIEFGTGLGDISARQPGSDSSWSKIRQNTTIRENSSYLLV